MSKRKDATGVGRRGFLKGAALAGAATTLASPLTAQATPTPPKRGKAPQGVSEIQKVAETAQPNPMADVPKGAENLVSPTSGSDFMVDGFKNLGFEYLAAMPGSSFRALQESFINYGKNTAPKWIECFHEEISVAMSHGYAKVEGKPMLNLVHATVGLQHASMAIYNAYADRVPIVIVTANIADATERRPGVEADHTVQDGAVIVRDYTKWDDSPGGLQHFAESTVRAYQIATTPPMGPVLLVADSSLQENPIPEDEKLTHPKLPRFSDAAGDQNAVNELAKMLVAAENPVIMADRGQPGPDGVLNPLVQLAEVLQCSIVDIGGRMNFPTQHALNQSDRRGAVLAQADVVVGLDMTDFWGVTHSYKDQLHRSSRPLLKAGTKTVSVTSANQFIRSNYQNFQRFTDVDLEISGDGAQTLPYLLEAVKKAMTDDKKNAFEARGKKLGDARKASFKAAETEAASGWDATPISTARLCMELWNVIKDEDYSLVSATQPGGYWSHKLWKMDKSYHYLGDAGAYGVGYAAGGAIGSALGNKKHGRFSVSIMGDGELMVGPGALWTAAKYQIPILTVMHNNRFYFQEVMHLQAMADRHMRDPHTAKIGTEIADPNIDFAKMAESFGMKGFTVTDPTKLGEVFKTAAAIVKKGEPVLVDVVSQGR
ncbi:MAG TPA: thiamine pyrophosphate-dependent enzyme [Stellaceae bacterium]|nr:thiamine pyrophosphate-dependent enzyme [Stellaceae bacterium]